MPPLRLTITLGRGENGEVPVRDHAIRIEGQRVLAASFGEIDAASASVERTKARMGFLQARVEPDGVTQPVLCIDHAIELGAENAEVRAERGRAGCGSGGLLPRFCVR